MKKLTISLAFLVACLALRAQQVPTDIDLGVKNPYPFISSLLLEINEAARADKAAGAKLAAQKFMPVKAGRVYVEIVLGNEADTDLKIDNSKLRSLPGVEITTTFVNRSSAWVEADQLLAVAQALPPNHRLSEVVLTPEDNQGPGLTNSDSYSGPGGSGILVGVIDSGFDMLTEARNAGAAPTAANTTTYNYTGSGIEATTRHGTGCLESVFDHAPDATYNLFKVNSLSDMGTAVTQAISNNVDILTHSLSRYNTGWGDNTGAACAAANNATANGMLFFTSCGNRNGTHWQGNFSDTDNDNWHGWNGGADELNNFTLVDNGVVQAYMQWNSASSTDHYDLFLYETGGGVLASSTNTNSFETIIYTNTSGSTQNVNLAVLAKTGSPPTFEVFNHDSGASDFQYASTAGSNSSPSNSISANVISVGALPRTSYDSPAYTTGIIASYSSRGPTNSSNQAPDICSPTNTTTVSYNGGFGGTSCATPNAAGVAAAFWSAHSSLNSSGVRHILFAKAGIYKDWGTAGADNLYGRGGIFLHDYSSLNRYVVSAAFNFTSSATLPYYSIGDIDDDAPVGSGLNIYYLDTSDNAPGAGNVINKPMIYRSVPGAGTVID